MSNEAIAFESLPEEETPVLDESMQADNGVSEGTCTLQLLTRWKLPVL